MFTDFCLSSASFPLSTPRRRTRLSPHISVSERPGTQSLFVPRWVECLFLSFVCLFVSPSCKYLIFFFIISILNIFLSTWCFKICFHSGDLGFLICFFPRWGHYSIILWLFSLPHYFCSLLFLTPISWIPGLLDLSVHVVTFSLWHGSPPPPSPSHKGNVLPFVQRPQPVSLTLHRLLYFHIVFLISKLSFNKCSPCTF